MKKSKVSNDCFVCAVYPLIQTIIFGHTVLKYQCIHLNSKFKSNKNFIILQIPTKFHFIWFLVLVAYFYYTLSSLLERFSISKSLSAEKIIELINLIGGISIFNAMLAGVIVANDRRLFLQGLQSLLENKQIYGFNIFLQKKFIQKWKSYFIRIRNFVIIYMIYNSIDLGNKFIKSNRTSHDIIQFMVDIFLAYFHATIFLFNMGIIKVFKDLFNQVLQAVKFLMHRQIENNIFKQCNFEICYEEYTFEEHLRNLRRFYSALYFNFKKFVLASEKFIPSLWVSQITLVVMQLYFVISAPYLINDYMVMVRSIQIYAGLIISLIFIRQLSQLENLVILHEIFLFILSLLYYTFCKLYFTKKIIKTSDRKAYQIKEYIIKIVTLQIY